MMMDMEGILKHLEKHYYLVFKYKLDYYTLQRKKVFFQTVYCLLSVDSPMQQQKSIEDLFKRAYVGDSLLIDVLRFIEIPSWRDPAWTTYKAVRHNAIIHNSEIHFLYGKKDYWISHSLYGRSLLSDNLGNTQEFNSCRNLFDEARIDNKSLEEIWIDVIVDTC